MTKKQQFRVTLTQIFQGGGGKHRQLVQELSFKFFFRGMLTLPWTQWSRCNLYGLWGGGKEGVLKCGWPRRENFQVFGGA